MARTAPSSPSKSGLLERLLATSRPAAYTYRRQKVITSVLFLLVPLVLLLVFTYLPALNMFVYSFADWDGFGPVTEYVGLQNYVDIFTRPEYFSVFTVSIYYFAGAIVQLVIALYLATILSFKVRFQNFFKGVLFFPYLINGVAVGFAFLYFFQPHGMLDSTLSLLGFGPPEEMPLWLGDRSLINISLAGVSIWRYMGFNFVMFLGAIQSIPSEVYEAADMDGAGRWQQFRYIIVPSIRPIIALSLILAVRGALAVFEVPYIMTSGLNGSATFVIQTVNMAFKLNKVGLASAMAIVLLLIIVIVTWIQNTLLSDKDKGLKL